MKRLIIFFIRTRLGLKKHECFQFANQKTNVLYYFTDTGLLEIAYGNVRPADVTFNRLLDDNRKVKVLKGGTTRGKI